MTTFSTRDLTALLQSDPPSEAHVLVATELDGTVWHSQASFPSQAAAEHALNEWDDGDELDAGCWIKVEPDKLPPAPQPNTYSIRYEVFVNGAMLARREVNVEASTTYNAVAKLARQAEGDVNVLDVFCVRVNGSNQPRIEGSV